jgi:EmrB/QacA subfamily drug resistance transporter
MKSNYKWIATIVAVVGLFMSVLDNTIVNVALPAMQTSFNTDRTTITWVVTGYFLSQAAVIPITGYLSDRYGTKLVYLIALTVFTLGSALCAFSPAIATLFSIRGESFLIAARIVQGIGGGALFPVVFAIAFRVFPPDERGPASAVIGVPILLAPAFGPTIGGFLTTNVNWNAIFVVNIPFGIAGLIAGIIVLRGHQAEIAAGDEPSTSKGFDVWGLILSMVGVTSLVYGINKAGEIISDASGRQHARGWTDHEVLLFLILGIALIVLFIIIELRSDDPVMDMRLFSNYTFSIGNIVMWVMACVLFGSLFLVPVFFEQVQGKTPLTTGEILIPQGLASAVAVIIAGRAYNSTGPRPLVIVGLVLTSFASYGFTHLSVNSTSSALQIWLSLRGLGLGLTNVPLQTFVISKIANQQIARASSLVNVTRQIFAAIGVTVLTTFMVQQSTNHTDAVTSDFKNGLLHQAQLQCANQFGKNAIAIQNCLKDAATAYVQPHALTLGLNDTFTITVIGCAICLVIAFFIGRDVNVERLKEARARGESVSTSVSPVGMGE